MGHLHGNQSHLPVSRNYLICILLFLFGLPAAAQEKPGHFFNVSFEYGIHLPAADMQDRFGLNFQLGSHLEMMHGNSHFLYGASFHMLFGSVVREDVLANLRTTDGGIIGNDRRFADIGLRQRGFSTQAYVGKIFNLNDRHYASGIKVTLGAGLLQHKVRIQDNSRTVTELFGEYVKGYDRLTNGISTNMFLGYQHLGRNRRINFLVGFDLIVAFTESRRDFDFLLMEKDTQKRIDILSGFKAGWIMPIGAGKKGGGEIIY